MLPYAAAELINYAADLSATSSVLTHEDERRWRIFHERVEQITAGLSVTVTFGDAVAG